MNAHDFAAAGLCMAVIVIALSATLICTAHTRTERDLAWRSVGMRSEAVIFAHLSPEAQHEYLITRR